MRKRSKSSIQKKIRNTVIALGLLLLFLHFPTWTPSLKDEHGAVLPNSVAVLEEIELGGVKQSILIRGKDRSNPVVLFLHGGPGYPQIGYARRYQSELENDFVVVNWDQRGAGKSYHWNLTEEDMKLDTLIEDTRQLTEYLKERFQQPKIYMVGHSWGSLLATWTVQKYPEHYHAYIGVGQVADSPQGELTSYEYVLEEAKRRNLVEAVRELEGIGAPPYQYPREDATLERKWVMAFGGSERGSDTYADMIEGILLAPEYSWMDGIRLALGDSFSRHAILPQTRNVKLADTVPELAVPVIFCMGRHDYMTPSAVAYSYFEKLKAPEKQFIWFEESAHFPHFEETEKFHEVMLELKKAMKRVPAGILS